jgi:hypothetical protein
MNIFKWFEHCINIERWNFAWDCVAGLYTISLTPSSSDSAPTIQSVSDAAPHTTRQHDLNENETVQEK